ncbi:MAG: hypothetical protein QOE40_361 [Actinomycetota bacterium]|nr:hypothetical protein [Actinomycetota bacterium]
MVGGTTTQRTSDPVRILNSVFREGWEVVRGSFVFVEMGSESRAQVRVVGSERGC